MRKILNPWIGKDGYHCFGCCPENETGLKLEFFEDGQDVLTRFLPHSEHQGWNGMLHGGISATLLDETMGWAVMRFLSTTGVTARMELRYSKPVLLTQGQVEVRARIKETRGRLAYLEAEIRSPRKEVLVTATATYFLFDKDEARKMGMEPMRTVEI